MCMNCKDAVATIQDMEDLCQLCSDEVFNLSDRESISVDDAFCLWLSWLKIPPTINKKRALLISDSYIRACKQNNYIASRGALKALEGAFNDK